MTNSKFKTCLILLAGVLPLFAVQTPTRPAAGPAVQLSPRPVIFGFVKRGEGKDLYLTVTNSGNSDLVVSSDEVFPRNNPFYVDADGCVGHTISAGGSCVVQLGFWPGDPYPVVVESAFVIFDNAGGGYQSVIMYGWDTKHPVTGKAAEAPSGSH